MISHVVATPYGEVVTGFVGNHSAFSASDTEARYRKLMAAFPAMRTLSYAEQVHGDAVLDIAAAAPGLNLAGEGDALLTNLPGHALLVRTADCIPVMFYDVAEPFAAAVHAGWRGLEKKILSKAVGRRGQNTASLRFVIGPFIGERSYEVGADVAGRFAARHSEKKPAEKFWLNLKSILTDEMQDLGISEEQICWFAHDTLTSPDWYSARRGDRERNFSFVYFSR